MNKYLYTLFFLSMLIHSVFTLHSLGNDAFGVGVQFALPGYCEFIMECIAVYYMLLNIPVLLNGPLRIKIFVWLCYVTFSVFLLSKGDSILFDLRQVLMWGTTFFMGFFIARDNPEYMLRFRKLIIVFLPVLIIMFYYISQFRTLSIDVDGVIASNNTIYFLLVLLPLLLIAGSKNAKTFFLIVIGICVMYSMKRTAFIALVLCALLYVYYFFLRNNKHILKKTFVVLTGVIFLCVLYSQLSDSYLVSRFESIQEDKGSNRLDIYAVVWDKITISSNSEILLGHGYNSVMRNNASGEGKSAHNDFLEILYDYGILGFILYVAIIISVIRLTLRVKRDNRNSSLFVPMAMSVFILLVVSMFSHLAIYPMYYIYLTCFWGMIAGRVQYHKVRNSNNSFAKNGSAY